MAPSAPSEQAAPAQPSAVGAPIGDEFALQILQLLPQVRAFLGKLQRGGPTYGTSLDDLVQESFTRGWRSRAGFDAQRGTLAAWLLRITFTVYLDHRATAPPTIPGHETLAKDPDPATTAATREHLVEVLAQLDDRERDLLLRFHRDGCSIAELAAATGLSTGTVKSLLHRARARLWAIERRKEPE